MDRVTNTTKKKLKSPGIDATANINTKTSVTCLNVPEGLFDATSAKKHFSKFGRLQKIRLFPKKQMCIIEYDQPLSVERAVLNAGAYDGFMFDVTRTKPRVRRHSRRDDDPDWLPDPDVEEELSAMVGAPSYRVSRQKPMEVEPEVSPIKTSRRAAVKPIRAKLPVRQRKSIISQPVSGRESPVAVTMTQTILSTSEAAAELHQLRAKICLTPDEQWRALDARDRILRAWGGAGSRTKVGGPTVGTCPDMCPEKELLHRQAEHQVMTLETVVNSDGQLSPWRAVKQYSRSSADQEMPMCYELRPAPTLMRTCAYLLHEIAEPQRQVTLADWFHFMWDRLRGIRKDITQQALCCAESIYLVEMCARFHAHCAARLADLEHTQFDQKLNTDNLTKCLQTLKHMYTDVAPELKPREAEFRGYIALLNLGDANFWWEIKQLPQQIQKSEDITLAIQIFNALDNNNYVRFFRLVKEKATYLQACILLRYFNDVRARALARIVKAYAPRGGSRYPAEELINSLSFESVESMRAFINHYGLRVGKDESELTVILDRNQFIEDMDPYPVARSINLIETKRHNTVGEVIAGGLLPNYDYTRHVPYSSFNKEGKLVEAALTAEDQGYNTVNDSNKNVNALRAEIQRLAQGGRNYGHTEKMTEPKSNLYAKPEITSLSPGRPLNVFIAPTNDRIGSKTFLFKPAIPIAPTEVMIKSPEKIFGNDTRNLFSFSKPQVTVGSNNMLVEKDAGSTLKGKNVFDAIPDVKNNKVFAKSSNENNDPLQNSLNFFKKPESGKSLFSQSAIETKPVEPNNVFGNFANKSKLSTKDGDTANQNAIVTKNIFSKVNEISRPDSSAKFESSSNIFAKTAAAQECSSKPQNIFGIFSKQNTDNANVFVKSNNTEGPNKSIFIPNGDATSTLSPGSLFKSAINSDSKGYSIFQSKNKAPTVADNILNSINSPKSTVYNFDPSDNQAEHNLQQQHLKDEIIKQEMEREIEEQMRKDEELKQEQRRQEEHRRKEDERRIEAERRRKQEEIKRLEEKKREEERRQEELRKKLEEERKAEIKRKAEEEEKQFKERVEQESAHIIEELVKEVNDKTVREIITEEMDKMKKLISYAGVLTEEICSELCNEISYSEMKAEKYWTDKLLKKWFYIWKKQFLRNFKRRSLLEDTPVWLAERSPSEEAAYLRRSVENAALKNMNAVHKGYRFTAELRPPPIPEPYNIMEIIKSPLLKRMKQINYPYDKCFFWKVTLVSPGEMQWICRKIELEKWLLDVFSDKKKHDISESLIRVEKQSWNSLMDFAISVSLTNTYGRGDGGEALEGTNGLLFYATEKDNICETIIETLKQKYKFQIVPVAIMLPKMENVTTYNALVHILTNLVTENVVSGFRIFLLDPQSIGDSLYTSTKTALKWLAKKYPPSPPLEIDYLKSVCQRYLGNEIWYRLKSEKDSRINIILKDLNKLVQCYNVAVDKLIVVLTNEKLFDYPSFPLEFKQYLDHTSPYPKPFEFIPTNARNSDNTSAIKDMMEKLKLQRPVSTFQPKSVLSMQDEIRKYCNQIGWFENPEQIVCKVVAVLPNAFSDLDMPCEQFNKQFEHYDLVDLLNIIVYEKINRLNSFDNRYAVYERSELANYRNTDWLYEVEVLSKMKHKALEYEDDLDMFIEAKRRKIARDSMEYLMLEDKDCTMVEENIKLNDEKISKYSDCKEAVKQLEKQIDDEKKKSNDLENLLKAALSNVY